MDNSQKVASVVTGGQSHAAEQPESVFTSLELTRPNLEGARARPDIYRRAKFLAAFVLVSMLATNAWLIYEARQNELEQAAVGNTNLVRAVAERVEGSIAEAEHILESVVYELERSELTADALERLQPILVNHVSNVEQLKGLFVYDAAGSWIATSEANWDKSLNNSDRAYFIHHRDSPSARALVSAPVVSRSSGEWIVPVSRRLVDANGKFAGVALATVSIKHLRALLERFDVGEHGAITLSVSGRILLRRPYVEDELSKPAPVSAFSALAASQRSGNTIGRSPIDGVERLVSFEHTRNFPIRVSVATSKDEVLRKWWVASWVQTVWVAFLCLVLWVAGGYFKRSMRYRVKAEAGMREARDALGEANARLAHMAQYDGLTGLPNRRFFDRRLARYTRQAQREQWPLAIVMVDVDEFKKYNDLYGHVEGDSCLKRVAASLLTAARRPEDVVARYGGEEIVLLLPNTDAQGAQVVAEAARAAVFALKIAHAASPKGYVSVSLGGAARIPQAAGDGEALLKAADAALYKAKHLGRNRVNILLDSAEVH